MSDCSRQLHDLTLLEIRRQVIAERRLKPIRVVDICHSKIAALERICGLAQWRAIFPSLYFDVRLGASLVLLARPENICRIRRGEPEATRENLELILNTDPDARPLFAI
jgi:hypothetical protein